MEAKKLRWTLTENNVEEKFTQYDAELQYGPLFRGTYSIRVSHKNGRCHSCVLSESGETYKSLKVSNNLADAKEICQAHFNEYMAKLFVRYSK